MISNFSPNNGCAIVYCISKSSLLHRKSIFYYKKNHHYFSFKLYLVKFGSFRHQRGPGETSVFVEKTILVHFLLAATFVIC